MKKLFWVLLLAGAAFAQSGPTLYQQNCAFCHGENGAGRPGAFPPLAAHTTDLVKLPEGRLHVLQAVLFGLQGQLKVKNSTYNGVMPSFAQLSDEQIAAVVNHVLTAWGNDKLLPPAHRPVTPAEVAAARANRLTAKQVGENRAKITLP